MTANKLQRLLFWTAWSTAALLLGRFVIDFIKEMPALLAAPFVLLVVVALGVAAILIIAGENSEPTRQRTQSARLAITLLLLSVPLGFLASSLDCTGLSLSGCTPFCSFIKVIWIPVLALGSLAYAIKGSTGLLGVVLLLSFVPLAPHCQCFNVGNGWWIERLGASPTCYAWGFAASLIALAALRAGRREWLAVLVNSAIIGGATAFFISHHYFHFPW
jgi:hypothetical protein